MSAPRPPTFSAIITQLPCLILASVAPSLVGLSLNLGTVIHDTDASPSSNSAVLLTGQVLSRRRRLAPEHMQGSFSCLARVAE